MAFFFNDMMSFIVKIDENANADPTPREVMNTFFNPGVLISLIIFAMTSLACRVLGIVYVAQSKTVSDGEKALWIIGFIIMGFITAIIFLIMAKGRKFTE
jgi:hypothetical protein